MRERFQISGGQFFALLYVFLIGTSTMLLPVSRAGRDAWIAVLLATAGGVGLFGLYAAIVRVSGGKTIIGAARLAFGPALGAAIGALYIWFFLHLGSLVLRNLVELYATAIMLRTPVLVFAIVITFLAAWSVLLGIEVIARTAEILTLLLLLGKILLEVLAFATPDLIHLERLLPILENGPLPVVQGTVPVLAFPFGETVLLAAILPYLMPRRHGWRIAAGAMGLAGLLLFAVVVRDLAVLGPTEFSRQTIPSLSSLTLISIGEFVQRIDAIVLVVWTYGIFAKYTITYYILSSSLAELLHLSAYRPLVLPLGIILVTLSLLVYENFGEMASFAMNGYPAYAFVFEIALPLLILAGVILKARRRKGKAASSGRA